MDVVPAAGDWTVDPFGGEVVGGRLYGRGAVDMKGGLAAVICGVAEAAATGRLSATVAVSATVLEETIEGLALRDVLDQLHPEAVIICEPTAGEIKFGQRGRTEILMTVRGTPAHSCRPEEGVSAIRLAARGLIALEQLELPSDPEMGQTILVATDVISDPCPSISMLPTNVRIRFDRRTLVGEEADEVLEAMAVSLSAVDPYAFSLAVATGEVITYTGVTVDAPRFFPAWRLEPDHPLVRSAITVFERVGCEPRLGVFKGCTNGSVSAGVCGIPTIGVGPGDWGGHAPDESMSVEQIRKGAQIYTELALELAG
jgi:putative selenium metabolism hydrolase